MKVLIADDNSTNLKLLHAQLEAEGFTVFDAADGAEGLAVLERETIDAVISDILMPRMDGYRFCHEVRHSENWKLLPFVVYTACYTSPADEKLALDVGADKFIRKPAPARTIIETLRELAQDEKCRAPRVIETPAQSEVLNQYSERLVSKLEEKNQELEQRTEDLQAANLQLGQLLENSPAVLYALRIEGDKVEPCMVSENILGFVGFTPKEALTYAWWLERLHPEDRERAIASLAETISQGSSRTEYRLRHKNGEYIWTEDKRRLVRDAGGRPKELAGVWTDITERRRAEEALRGVSSKAAGSRQRKAAWEMGGICVLLAMVFFLEHHFSFFLPVFLELADQERHPFADEFFVTLFFLTVALAFFAYRRWRESMGEARSQQHIAAALAVLHDELDKRVRRRTEELARSNVALQTQIAERERAEAALRESERRFSEMLGKVDLIAAMLDIHGRVTYANAYLLDLTGWKREELVGRDWMEVFIPPENASKLQEVFAALIANKPETWHYENEILTRRRERRLVRWNNSVLRSPEGQVIGTASIGEDITERKRNERLALRSQRLESIGTLAGGVAHDLNNALAPIMMGAEVLRMQHPKDTEIIDMFYNSAKRGADMVRQLLSFAKGAEGDRILIQPAHLIKEMRQLVKNSFPKNIELKTRFASDLPSVLGDATQLHQVLLNLCVNARDAMPEGGTLTLEAETAEVDAAYAAGIAEAKPGSYVLLRVRDTGSGIPPEILDRIFDPFFTTKSPDKGTGLGLSTVMGIVKGHGGFLHVYSQVGKGTTFGVYLPFNRGANETAAAAKPEAEYRGHGETILLIDDEAPVREMGRAVLRRLNFTPVTASSGAEGLILAAEHRGKLAAIITDLHMPHSDGLAFVRSVRQVLPDIPIAVSSGRVEDSEIEEFKKLRIKRRLDKPFTEGQMASALRELLAP